MTRLSPPGDSRAPGPLGPDEFWTVVNGSADDAVQTELFGLERVISDTSEILRGEIARLEVKQLRGKLTKREQERLEFLLHQLPRDPNTKIVTFGRMLEQIE